MDFYIFDLCKRHADHIHYWSHILVGNLVVLQQNLVDMNRLVDRQLLGKWHDFHTGLARMGLLVAKLLSKEIHFKQ